MSTGLPPVAPEVLAEAVGSLTARLRKKLDAATASGGAGARRAGLTTAAELAAALAAEADRRPRDAFGRLADPSAECYARAWLAAAVHLAAAERSLVAASWAATPRPATPGAR